MEVCEFCGDVPLTQCVNQSHWEKRLKALRLTPDRAGDPRIESPNGSRVDRLVSLSPQDADKKVVPPLVLPEDPELQQVFVAESLGLSFSRCKQKDTTYADINVFERCASPRYRRTA